LSGIKGEWRKNFLRFLSGHEFNALKEEFHHTNSCWVIAEMDAIDMLAILA